MAKLNILEYELERLVGVEFDVEGEKWGVKRVIDLRYNSASGDVFQIRVDIVLDIGGEDVHTVLKSPENESMYGERELVYKSLNNAINNILDYS